MLLHWLSETAVDDPCDPLVTSILDFFLHPAVAAPAGEGRAARGGTDHVERLLPALERLRVDPGATVPLADAAAVCSLSPPISRGGSSACSE